MEKKHHSLITITFKARKIILLVAEHTTGTKFGRIGPSYLAQKKNICGKNLCFQPILGAPKRSSSKSSGYTTSLTIAIPVKNGRNPPNPKKNHWTNHFCCEPESFLKVHTIDTIGLSPYLGRTTLTEKMGKIRHGSKAPSCSSLHHLRILFPQLWQEKSQKMPEFSNIMMSWCHASKIKGFQTQDNIPTSPCPNERPDHSPLAVGPRAGQGFSEFMSNGQIVRR